MVDTNLKIHKYDETDIQVLEGLEGVRVRPAMYIGSTNSTGLHHLVWEIIDNSVDEALNGFGNKISVCIHKDGSITISDEGRGIPCGIHKKENIPTIQLILSTLHSGGKFNDNAYSSSAGLHGVGSSVTNALSEFFDATIYRDNKIYHIRFEKGGSILSVPLEILGNTNKHGSVITFKPDHKIFQVADFKYDIIRNHLQESAFLLGNVHFLLTDERIDSTEEFYYKDGLIEYINTINENKTPLNAPIYFEDNKDEIKIQIAFQYCVNDYNETLLSYVNNIRTKDGGTHETGFKIAITRAVNDFAEESKLLKNKLKFEANDIREGLTAIIALKIPESILEFEGQTKGKLGTQEAVSIVSNFFYNELIHYLNENKEFSLNLISKCLESQRVRVASRKAKEDIRANKKVKNDVTLSKKLTSAQSKDYKNNELFIVEGDSAGGSAKKGRDYVHQAILPLRGKPLNVESIGMDKMLKNEEFATIISTIGAGVGQEFDVTDSHYGKIIIMTDADTDGAHIQTLLLTFFYYYMRPLITNGMVYVAVPPLYRVSKDASSSKKMTEIYCWNDDDLEAAKKKIGNGYKISRYKGLGEMNADQLKDTTMRKETRMLLKVDVEDPLLVERRINVLMGNDVVQRKKWVEENVNFSEQDNFKDKVKNG
ncbi:MAG: DNA topoisomerase IV subunit B [Bacilli bacterium]